MLVFHRCSFVQRGRFFSSLPLSFPPSFLSDSLSGFIFFSLSFVFFLFVLPCHPCYFTVPLFFSSSHSVHPFTHKTRHLVHFFMFLYHGNSFFLTCTMVILSNDVEIKFFSINFKIDLMYELHTSAQLNK